MGSPTLPGIPAVKRRPRNTAATPEDYKTWDLCRAAFDVIAAHVEIPISKTAWTTRNNRYARELIEGGKTIDEALSLLQWGFTDPKARRYFSRISSLRRFIDHWPTMAAMRAEAEREHRHVCADGTIIYGNENDPAPLSELAG